MNLEDVRRIKVKRQKRHRVGRGQGSGWGTTSGRGHKGAGQRSGNCLLYTSDAADECVNV